MLKRNPVRKIVTALASLCLVSSFTVSADEMVGALIGGAIGSKVGQGRGQIAATAAGAYLGMKAGEKLSNPDAPGINAGNALGAVVGGAVGSQFGGGNGRLAATAAGAVVGAKVSDRMDENRRRAPRPRVPEYYEDDGYASAPRYYAPPTVHYLSPQPGGPIIIQGGGY